MKRMIMRLINVAALSILIFGGSESLAQGFSFPVEHDHMIKSCKGDLIINHDGVEYRTEHDKDARKWTYTDIRMIELVSSREIKVLTYESSWMKLGRDETFEFKVLNKEIPKEVSDFLLSRVARPLATIFVESEEKELREIAVRHRHRFGGCQGTVKIYADGVAYESEKPKSSRYWRWSDIEGISRLGPYRFEVVTYEPRFGGPRKAYNFDLKERMDDTVYDYLWAKVYGATSPALLEGSGNHRAAASDH